MNKIIENKLKSIALNGFKSPLEKLYEIGIILSYEIEDNNIYQRYYKYYEDFIWSQIQLIETFNYDDNLNYFQKSIEKEECAW